MEEYRQFLQTILEQQSQKQISLENRRCAGVLLPIIWREKPFIVLTKRSNHVENHKGEISFPGGSFEPHDKTLKQTALRESEEEIGLPPSQVEVLGALDDTFVQVSSFVVRPFVGWLSPPYQFTVDETETAEVLEIPLDYFLNDANYQPCKVNYHDMVLHRHAYPWREDRIIWGATARILRSFCQVIKSKELV